MSQQVRGVVAGGTGEPVAVRPVAVPDPGTGAAVVAVQSCGVCHTGLDDVEAAFDRMGARRRAALGRRALSGVSPRGTGFPQRPVVCHTAVVHHSTLIIIGERAG